MANQQTVPIIFSGGLNLAASVLELNPGECIQLFNYEVNTLSRYQRILGYERRDGQPAPSEVDQTLLPGYPFPDDESRNLAIKTEREARRALITALPGSGPVLGVVIYQGVVYGFRNNADSTACNMYRSTVTGWEQVATPALAPDGRFEFRIANFGASSSTIKLYGVDGQNPLFEFDGTTFNQITGPITGKHPTHLEVLSSQVMVNAYEGGTFVFSSVGDPADFSIGGGEIGVGDEITALDLQANNAMAVFCRNRTYILYGTSKQDFQLQDLSKTTGATEWAVQSLGDSIYLDDRGLTRLNRVQQFGNFDSATISQKVEPLLQRYIRRVTASFVIKEKNQFRLCFDDGTGLIVTFFGAEVSGFSTFDYGKVIRCAWSGEDENGHEVVLFGSDDGFIYQAEKGFSFDGGTIPHACRPAYNNLGNSEVKKRFRKVVLEIDALDQAQLFVIPEFDYSDPDQPYHAGFEFTATGGGGFWDQAVFDVTVWSAAQTYTADIYIDGVARNMSPVISGDAEEEPPHILNSLIVHFSVKGRRR